MQARIRDHDFMALIGERIGLQVEIDVRVLRPQSPGRVIREDGDIDNQLKILFDALRRPRNTDEVPAGSMPNSDEHPFLCALDDDSAIRTAVVRSERLLGAETPEHIIAILRLEIRAAFHHWTNAHLVG